MSILTWIEDKKRLKVLAAPKYVNSSADSSKGLWTRCDKCGVILYIKHLKENQRVCFGCSYHLQMMSQERIENLLDKVLSPKKPGLNPKRFSRRFSQNFAEQSLAKRGFAEAKLSPLGLRENDERSSLESRSSQGEDQPSLTSAKQNATSSYSSRELKAGSKKSQLSESSRARETRSSSQNTMVSTWRPLDETVSPCDPLRFHDQKNYTDRLQDAQERTGLQDAIQTGTGMIDGIPVALAVMDFSFMGGSMGSVVGEKITRLIEYATQEGLTLLIVSASGGARMQEGVFSLMQMAKISSALQIYQSCAKLLYISILTSPTTGGVTASFAMLGDIIFAEPKALIAFAGRRVIEQTLAEDLPDDFQTSEYMLHHGLVDLIVPRRFLRQALSESIRLYQNAPFKKVGTIPFGVQNPITFLTEEKVRRQWGALTEPGTNRYAEKRFAENSSICKQSKLSQYKAELCTPQFFRSGFEKSSSDTKLESNFATFTGLQSSALHDKNLEASLFRKSGESLNEIKHGVYREILTSFEMMLNVLAYGKSREHKQADNLLQSGALHDQNNDFKIQSFATFAPIKPIAKKSVTKRSFVSFRPIASQFFEKNDYAKPNRRFAQQNLASTYKAAHTNRRFVRMRSFVRRFASKFSPVMQIFLQSYALYLQAEIFDPQKKKIQKQSFLGFFLRKKRKLQGFAFAKSSQNDLIFGVRRYKKNLPLHLILETTPKKSRDQHLEKYNGFAGYANRSFAQQNLASTYKSSICMRSFVVNGEGEAKKNDVFFNNIQNKQYQKLFKDLYRNSLQNTENLKNENGNVTINRLIRKINKNKGYFLQSGAYKSSFRNQVKPTNFLSFAKGDPEVIEYKAPLCFAKQSLASTKHSFVRGKKICKQNRAKMSLSKHIAFVLTNKKFLRVVPVPLVLQRKISFTKGDQSEESRTALLSPEEVSSTRLLLGKHYLRFASFSNFLRHVSLYKKLSTSVRLTSQLKEIEKKRVVQRQFVISAHSRPTQPFQSTTKPRPLKKLNQVDNREKKDRFRFAPFAKNNATTLSLPVWPRNKINRFALLHNFRCFSEALASETFNFSEQKRDENNLSQLSKDTAASKITADTYKAPLCFAEQSLAKRGFAGAKLSPLGLSKNICKQSKVSFTGGGENEVMRSEQNADINFLNQAIELAATNSVEWRAFYIYQQLSENTGFLEDFLQQDHNLTEKNGNVFFYKSISRSRKALDE